MRRHDPDPSQSRGALRRFRRIVKYLGVASLAAAALAVVLVASGSAGPHIRLLIAAALALGLGVFVATAVISLVFLRPPRSHEARANRFEETDE